MATINPKLTFLGGVETVTGSCYLLEAGSKKILIDCGVKQGNEVESEELSLPIEEEVDYCILTHAHLDHSGLLPLLVKRKKIRRNIISTIPTKLIARILLEDFAKLYHSTYGKVIYTNEDIENTFNKWITYDYNVDIPLTKSLTVRFYDASHIIGSSSVHIKYHNEYDILFTGDIGTANLMLLDYPPKKPQVASYVVMESTYGDKTHENNLSDTIEFIKDVIKNGGKVLIPAFAVGRAQEVIYILNKNNVKAKIYLDSPMANKVTELSMALSPFLKQLRDLNSNLFNGYIPVEGYRDSLKLAKSKDPAVIISASGMLTGGRVLNHLNAIKDDEKSAVVFVGYQAEGTRGRKILSGEEKVKCRVFQATGLSAHADKQELIDYVLSFKVKPKAVFLTHGESSQRKSLKNELLDHGFNVVLPYEGDSVELEKGYNHNIKHKEGEKKHEDYGTLVLNMYKKGILSLHKVRQLAEMLRMGKQTALVWLNTLYIKDRMVTDLYRANKDIRNSTYERLKQVIEYASADEIMKVIDSIREEKSSENY